MRPELNRELNPEEFLNFYWLKQELFDFCKSCDIPASGSKKELTERIYHFLKSGAIISPIKRGATKRAAQDSPLTLESTIPEGYKNDERHRAFFKSVIGEQFKFNVPFMNWMKSNHGKSYAEAVAEWKRIARDKKSGKKSEISAQFEYNQYTRDFFEANPGRSRAETVKCWNYKKSLPGHNRYEDGDLDILAD